MHHFSYGESHPGIRLRELLHKSPALTHETLAKQLGISTYRLRTLLKGTKAIDIDMALKLACLFPEHTARDWLDMQTAHDLHQACVSGKMDAIAREMGVEQRNRSKVAWFEELKQHSDSIAVPLRCPLNHMVAALCEKLGRTRQDMAIEAIQRFWRSMDQDELDQTEV